MKYRYDRKLFVAGAFALLFALLILLGSFSNIKAPFINTVIDLNNNSFYTEYCIFSIKLKFNIINPNDIKYGIEVIKTSYLKRKANIEKSIFCDIIKDELKIEKILEILKQHKVTPISAEYIIEDLLKEQETKTYI